MNYRPAVYMKDYTINNQKTNTMKTGIRTFFGLVALTMIGLVSCEKTEDLNPEDIEGVYIGTFSMSSFLKSSALTLDEEDPGTAEVTMMEGTRIEVHCFGEEIDTTFLLNYYGHNDSIMVCLTGTDFEHHYGHMLGQGHMGGGMMSDMGNGDTEWMHHLNDEHEEGDEHFGGFNMHEKSFTYSFRMMDGSTPYYLRFHGIKQ